MSEFGDFTITDKPAASLTIEDVREAFRIMKNCFCRSMEFINGEVVTPGYECDWCRGGRK